MFLKSFRLISFIWVLVLVFVSDVLTQVTLKYFLIIRNYMEDSPCKCQLYMELFTKMSYQYFVLSTIPLMKLKRLVSWMMHFCTLWHFHHKKFLFFALGNPPVLALVFENCPLTFKLRSYFTFFYILTFH